MSTTTRKRLGLGRSNGLLRTYAATYVAICALTLGALFVLSIPPNDALARWWIGDRLNLKPHNIPSIGDALDILMHNLRVAGWPLLCIALGLHRDGWTRDLGSILLSGFVAVNTSLVGAAMVVGGAAIWPYLVHLPVEWAALALSTTAWVLATDGDMDRRRLAWVTAGFVVLLAVAAVLETYAVPHL